MITERELEILAYYYQFTKEGRMFVDLNRGDNKIEMTGFNNNDFFTSIYYDFRWVDRFAYFCISLFLNEIPNPFKPFISFCVKNHLIYMLKNASFDSSHELRCYKNSANLIKTNKINKDDSWNSFVCKRFLIEVINTVTHSSFNVTPNLFNTSYFKNYKIENSRYFHDREWTVSFLRNPIQHGTNYYKSFVFLLLQSYITYLFFIAKNAVSLLRTSFLKLSHKQLPPQPPLQDLYEHSEIYCPYGDTMFII